MMKKKSYAFIFARGGSKGLPGKNIRSLNDRPLIEYAIQHALDSKLINKVFVSTDSEEIAEVAKKAGAEVPFLRPLNLASDNAGEWLAWQHAVNFVKKQYNAFDIFVSLPATAPCRKLKDVERCIYEFQNSEADMVFTVTEAQHNPHFTMVRQDEKGFARLFNDDRYIIRRQDAPKAYGITPVAYVTSPDFILKNSSVWDGSVKVVEVDAISAIDIDQESDFYLAELVLKDRIDNAC